MAADQTGYALSLRHLIGFRRDRREAGFLFVLRVDHPPCGITSCRELISVAVAQIDCDPVVRDRLVDPALEIAIAYIEKIIALKHAARRYPVTRENVEDLAADILIGGSVKHRRPLRGNSSDAPRLRQHRMNKCEGGD